MAPAELDQTGSDWIKLEHTGGKLSTLIGLIGSNWIRLDQAPANHQNPGVAPGMPITLLTLRTGHSNRHKLNHLN
jgi:hypothetical protein